MKLVRRTAPRVAFAAALLVAAPVLAQDSPEQPAGPGADAPPAGPAAPDAPAGESVKPAEAPKPERKVDAKAVEAYDRYRKLLATPTSLGAKQLSATGEIELAQLGGEKILLKPSWKKGEKLQLAVELPEFVASQMTPEELEQQKAGFLGLVGPFVRPFFDDPMSELEDYNLEWREDGEKRSVVMTPCKDDAKAERVKVSFGADGLVTKMVNTPKVDPNDPNAAMMAGADIEVDIKHEKRGELFVVTSIEATLPFGVFSATTTYFEGRSDGPALAKSITVSAPMFPEPMVVVFSDYKLDDKAVEGTAKPAAAAPAEPAQPAEPAGPDAGPGQEPGPGADK